MPKETIAVVRRGDCPAPNDVEVRWHRDAEMVHIVTSCPERLVSATVLRHPVPEDPGPTDEGQPFGGWMSELDRHAINKLIRVLRQARDQTFGRDE